MNAGRTIALVGTLLMAIGAGSAAAAGPVWLAVVLIAGVCAGGAGVFAGGTARRHD